MQLEEHRQVMLQLHLSDQHFYCYFDAFDNRGVTVDSCVAMRHT